MDPFFTEEQLNNMSRENMMEVMRIMQNQVQKKETEVQLLKDKQKELEFMNAMLSDRLALAQRRRFGSSSEKYADGYEQMDLFNEAEVNADMDTAEIDAVYDAQRSPFCFRTAVFRSQRPPIFS
ncbi:transposase [Roseburia intestinalis]|uniref:Transposase TnpC homeodomain domain-containing protein n=2 Tax=Roseburia intestinalis L1-82 TaxID=536231 RepID=A0AAQ2UAG3_9FIRM|nr:transposase [Roseburia intestinalis]UWP56416.1 transposase [Roseburia intestinalis]VCV20445.1 hypothetical protein RIL182_00300 [Roseburia intestinalis L1-82]VCV20955.1 hypothetical protein RIL182_00817 [Roseburia intestinalis L1-82]